MYVAQPDRARAMRRRATFTRSDRLVSRDLHTPHEAAEGAGVLDRQVLHAAVVPEGHRTVGPVEAAGELWAVAMLEQEAQERAALLLRQALESHGVRGVDEETFPAGLGMRAHDRVHADRLA